VVKVVNEGVTRADALLEAALKPMPFFEGQDARLMSKGHEALGDSSWPYTAKGLPTAMEQGAASRASCASRSAGCVSHSA